MLYPTELRTRNGRGERIRTFDIQLPKLARYQTALRPEQGEPYVQEGREARLYLLILAIKQ